MSFKIIRKDVERLRKVCSLMSCSFIQGELGRCWEGWRTGLVQASEKCGDDPWERTNGNILLIQGGEEGCMLFLQSPLMGVDTGHSGQWTFHSGGVMTGPEVRGSICCID